MSYSCNWSACTVVDSADRFAQETTFIRVKLNAWWIPMMSFHSHAKALARVVCQLTMSYIFNVLKLELFWLWSSNWVSHYTYFHSFIINFPSITANIFAPFFATLPAASSSLSHDVHWTFFMLFDDDSISIYSIYSVCCESSIGRRATIQSGT